MCNAQCAVRTVQCAVCSVQCAVRGVFSTRGPDSSVGGVPVVNCPDVDHMEEEVQLRVQVEEEGTGETHGKD